ncbi:HD domain-containing protein [Streptomyces sp. NPDC127119]|uniref:HD domain-containing protein n=1 Tax=Streptomyces sp. NPDC127119 TaxID=3345370 RepID=UPI00362D050E
MLVGGVVGGLSVEVDESARGKSRGLDPGQGPYLLVRHLLDAAAMGLFLWDCYLSDGQRRCIAARLRMPGDLGRARLFGSAA